MEGHHGASGFLQACCVCVCMLLASLLSCSEADNIGPEMVPATPSGSDLFVLITQADPYQDWTQFPDKQGIVPSSFPHGPMARIFINGQVVEALSNFTGTLSDGAIIVKENIGESEADKADALTIMWKVPGFDPENGDWFWANISPEGEVAAEGKLASCISCHNGARDNDFVFVHQF